MTPHEILEHFYSDPGLRLALSQAVGWTESLPLELIRELISSAHFEEILRETTRIERAPEIAPVYTLSQYQAFANDPRIRFQIRELLREHQIVHSENAWFSTLVKILWERMSHRPSESRPSHSKSRELRGSPGLTFTLVIAITVGAASAEITARLELTQSKPQPETLSAVVLETLLRSLKPEIKIEQPPLKSTLTIKTEPANLTLNVVPKVKSPDPITLDVTVKGVGQLDSKPQDKQAGAKCCCSNCDNVLEAQQPPKPQPMPKEIVFYPKEGDLSNQIPSVLIPGTPTISVFYPVANDALSLCTIALEEDFKRTGTWIKGKVETCYSPELHYLESRTFAMPLNSTNRWLLFPQIMASARLEHRISKAPPFNSLGYLLKIKALPYTRVRVTQLDNPNGAATESGVPVISSSLNNGAPPL